MLFFYLVTMKFWIQFTLLASFETKVSKKSPYCAELRLTQKWSKNLFTVEHGDYSETQRTFGKAEETISSIIS